VSPDRRRLLIAAAFAIAVHEVLAGLVPPERSIAQQPPEIVARVQMTRVSVRATPTPKPKPRPRQHVITHVHVIAVLSPHRVTHRSSGTAARHETIRRSGAPRPKPMVVANARPVWDTPPPVGGNGSGAGNGANQGSVGNGVAAAGSGTGSTGSGTDDGGGNEPCGFVDFSDPHGSQYDRHTHGFWVDIRMSVRFPDGSTQSVILDYPWYYASEADNPWSDRNLRDPNFPTRFQPPPLAKAASEPALVQYVIAHSTTEGLTLLHDCPTPPPTPPSSQQR
jgi:hypothetical protein